MKGFSVATKGETKNFLRVFFFPWSKMPRPFIASTHTNFTVTKTEKQNEVPLSGHSSLSPMVKINGKKGDTSKECSSLSGCIVEKCSDFLTLEQVTNSHFQEDVSLLFYHVSQKERSLVNIWENFHKMKLERVSKLKVIMEIKRLQ